MDETKAKSRMADAHDNGYKDFSTEIEPSGRNQQSVKESSGGVGLESNCSSYARYHQHTFPVKLHYMLSEMDADGLTHVVSWQPHGRCFMVHDPNEFVRTILPL